MIYLDNAATSMPKPACVHDAVMCALSKMGSLGRSHHKMADFASETAYDCRRTAAKMFDAQEERVAFTFNATHGLNIAIKSLVKRGDKVVVSGFEHNAVLRPLHAIGAEIKVAGTKLFDQVDTLSAMSNAIDEQTKAVICTHVSNVFGYILPIKEISFICKKRNVPFIIDASQSAGVLPVSMKELGAAYIAMPGHKGLCGPQGTGLLICGEDPMPVLEGGTGSLSRELSMPDFLPDRLEAGTQNIHGLAGLLAGMRFILAEDNILSAERAMIRMLTKRLDLDAFMLFHGSEDVQSGVLSFVPRRESCETFAQRLSEADIAIRSGLQCAPLAHQSAGTLDSGTIRVSVGATTRVCEIETFLDLMSNMKKS